MSWGFTLRLTATGFLSGYKDEDGNQQIKNFWVGSREADDYQERYDKAMEKAKKF